MVASPPTGAIDITLSTERIQWVACVTDHFIIHLSCVLLPLADVVFQSIDWLFKSANRSFSGYL